MMLNRIFAIFIFATCLNIVKGFLNEQTLASDSSNQPVQSIKRSLQEQDDPQKKEISDKAFQQFRQGLEIGKGSSNIRSVSHRDEVLHKLNQMREIRSKKLNTQNSDVQNTQSVHVQNTQDNDAIKADLLNKINRVERDGAPKIDAKKKIKNTKIIHKVMYTLIGSLIVFYLFRCTKQRFYENKNKMLKPHVQQAETLAQL